ncbi:homeobox protein CDX-4-like [Trichosurus vulpecula]|uniref:homeobox protein CDX-4-like n=1 Tax=Trichosurus vulpecula TaxID=9337 RepID=UPI00186AE890|nr:homeobox protein CDX-4-like [Trichosurus vulpecula]
MWGSCLVKKEGKMHPGSQRATGLGSNGIGTSMGSSGGGIGGGSGHLPAQAFSPAPAYPHSMSYSHMANLDGHGQWLGPWGSTYGPPREDWAAYGEGPSSSVVEPSSVQTLAQVLALAPTPAPYGATDYSNLVHPGPSGVLPPENMEFTEPTSNPPNIGGAYAWMSKTLHVSGKTRTKEKYRVVYSEHQRLELEKEFHVNRYISIRKKTELAGQLGLSERQVKIWFQNRRAKERKLLKKKISESQATVGNTAHSDSSSVSPREPPKLYFPPPPPMGEFQPIDIHQILVSE